MGLGRITQLNTIRGFSRLKKVFVHNLNLEHSENFMQGLGNPIIGNIPKDLMELLIKYNSQSKGVAIKTAQNAYTEAAVILSDVNKLHQQALKRAPMNIECAAKIAENMQRGNPFFYKDKIFSEKIAEYTLKAEQQMINRLKPLIPDLSNVKISYIGYGSYSDVFKCEIFNANGQKIVADRVIKTFHDNERFTGQMFSKMNDILSKYSDKNISRYAAQKGYSADESAIAMLKSQLAIMTDNTSNQAELLMYRANGAFAEANITEYIRHYAGNVTEAQGIVLPDMYNLSKHPYTIAKYIEKDAVPEKLFRFDRLGLEHTDFQTNPQNSINGICIDIGGIFGLPSLSKSNILKQLQYAGKMTPDESAYAYYVGVRESNVLGDKLGMHIWKRVMDCPQEKQMKLIETIRKEAYATKNELERSKILKALDELADKDGFIAQNTPKAQNALNITG